MHSCLCLHMDKLGTTMITLALHDLPVSIDHEGDVPVYIQLADILRARIESGELAPRRPVPSKRTLMQEYGVAGGTVDKAIGILRGEGLVRTVVGRGIYVIDRS
jgi:DNA-binding GntR family transcriptional regulator